VFSYYPLIPLYTVKVDNRLSPS